MEEPMPGKQTPKKPAKDDDAARKAARIEEERTAYDPHHAPTERNARIDGSGARFESDG
jgi:hypothetical protein